MIPSTIELVDQNELLLREQRLKFALDDADDAYDIAAHPANVAYSMDASAIRQLASSIKRDGLTDLPLVRRLADGGFQMISGHRRLEAFRLLAKDDESFSRIPCRIVEASRTPRR